MVFEKNLPYSTKVCQGQLGLHVHVHVVGGRSMLQFQAHCTLNISDIVDNILLVTDIDPEHFTGN